MEHGDIADLDKIVGERIWLEYFDQNVTFEQAFTPQYCKVLRRYTTVDGTNDWYLIGLQIPLEYKGIESAHLMIRSRWVGCKIGAEESTAVFIVLVPDPNGLTNPWKMDRSLYIAWGTAANDAGQIKR